MTQEKVWNAIATDSYNFEQSMDQLHRKQTGSYYTALELTLAMMQEMIDNLDEEKRNKIYELKFLEPCVGTGNFVFAYLRVCSEMNLSVEQYEELLNNIFVCDINKDALEVYKANLKKYASDLWGIHLSDTYFDNHIGSGLMIDVDADEMNYISIDKVFPESVIGEGFDFVVTNPPYKNLKAERGHYTSDEQYETDKRKYGEIGKLAKGIFPYSTAGILNLYKMFVEEIVEHYVAKDGICSLLIPASILSDKTCSKLRTRIIDTTKIVSLRVISESSNYVDASQALCAMLLIHGGETDEIYIDGSFTGKMNGGTIVAAKDFLDVETGNAILVLTPEQYRIRKQMQNSPLIKNLDYISNLRGELDITMNGGAIVQRETPYKMFRGRNIGFYKTIDTTPVEYVDETFVENTTKRKFVLGRRLVCQQIANMAKERRISFAEVPENSVLGNSCNFIFLDENSDGVDFEFLYGILNSKLIDWYFKLTSSNNHINNYEIDNFPIPIGYEKKELISAKVKAYLLTEDESILDEIESLVYEAYGLNEKEKTDVPEENGEFTGVLARMSCALDDFLKDSQMLIPAITKEECVSVLNADISLMDVANAHGVAISDFDKKVLANMEIKYRKISRGEVLNHTTFKLSDLDLEMIKPVPQGGSWKDIPQETVQKSKRLARITQTGGRTTLYGRIDYSKPSYTITTYFNRPGNGTYVHPVHERVLSVREAARFQCFPDEYSFFGNKTDMLKQVGNAVPVLLAYNIGRAIKQKTGCSVSVDLFSGAGGMTFGFKEAGIKAAIANDIIENACVTLKTNSPEIPVLCGDITEAETKKTIIEAGVKAGADIICGGPPCQGFSMAGWRMKDDPRNELFRHFVDIVSGVNPKVIVFENVEGILSYQGGETYRNIIELFSELGYNCEGRKLMANHYGAPQRRKRVIILCTRKDIGVLPSEIFPDPITPNMDRQMNAYETLYDLEQIECGENAKYASEYTSPLLDYLKGYSDAETYLEKIYDSRGVLDEDDSEITEEDMEDSSNEKPKKKKVKKKKEDDVNQLSLFDLFEE